MLLSILKMKKAVKTLSLQGFEKMNPVLRREPNCLSGDTAMIRRASTTPRVSDASPRGGRRYQTTVPSKRLSQRVG